MFILTNRSMRSLRNATTGGSIKLAQQMYITYVILYNFDSQICTAVGSYSPEVVVINSILFNGDYL